MDHLPLILTPLLHIGIMLLLSTLPAYGLVLHVSVDPLTRLFLAVGGSYLIMFLAEFGAYVWGLPQWVPIFLCMAASLISVWSMFSRKHRESVGRPMPWRGLLIWAGLAVWILSFQTQIVVYGAANWFGDWHEHYARAILFLTQLPPDTTFMKDLWSLPARGPLFNTAAALLMGIVGREFWVFQEAATVLNTWPVLPLALLLRDMGRLEERTALVISTIILAIAPFAVENEVFTWTKFFTAGFVLGGIHMYRLGLVQNKANVTGWSFGIFSAGILAHYLVVLYLPFFVAHFLYTVFRYHWPWKIMVYPALGCAGLLMFWFGYQFATFGIVDTLRANSTLGAYAEQMAGPGEPSPPRSMVFLANVVTTALPYSWRHDFQDVGHAPRFIQRDLRAGPDRTPDPSELNRKTEWLSDLAAQPSSLPGALGIAGCLAVVIIAWQHIRAWRTYSDGQAPADTGHEPHPSLKHSVPGPLFWGIFIVGSLLLHIAAVPTYAQAGIVHLSLQAVICLAAVWIVRWGRLWPRLGQTVVMVIFILESAIVTGGILALQERTVPLTIIPGKEDMYHVVGKLAVNPLYVKNYALKLKMNARFLSDHLEELKTPTSLVAVCVAIILLFAGTTPRPAAPQRKLTDTCSAIDLP